VFNPLLLPFNPLRPPGKSVSLFQNLTVLSLALAVSFSRIALPFFKRRMLLYQMARRLSTLFCVNSKFMPIDIRPGFFYYISTRKWGGEERAQTGTLP